MIHNQIIHKRVSSSSSSCVSAELMVEYNHTVHMTQ